MGIAASTTAMVFEFLKSRSEARGGILSTADLEQAHAHFLASLPKATEYFESVDRRYMQASGSPAPELLSRESILVTLLIACGHKAAHAAFPQVEHIGERWLRQLFGGVARYVRAFTSGNVDERLIAAYFKLATRLGGRLRIADLLSDDETKQVLLECLAPLIAKGAGEKLAQPLSDVVTTYIAAMRAIAGADPVKVTAGEIRKFLSFLPLELRIELGPLTTDEGQRPVQFDNETGVGEAAAI